mmetsp:Transcript_9931/g.26348  ORF Transcript_9931/g.26348 Transcript_9931/m.26348 type:complete len:384 (-) Transcript_9931:38-1189(-)|eukprot:CAMPEP_0113889820 /NCGR_PEP_ID=MMETSP0780_2-20120614/13752_1 /TAXON_ID=652834 /ORGANISM="Palpitomonas bilix" /LENGTH=383 /DNA_ID=CAMNT_0000879047 /DNA_START=70 /DNA_END=1221 /DNA_ORIENTATION=- /assembly_acc=CAM_ASM_000599
MVKNVIFVGVPTETPSGAPRARDSLELVENSVRGAATVSDVKLPELRVGTLDSLLELSDELVKHDQFAESTVLKIEREYRETLKNDGELLVSLRDQSGEREVDVQTYTSSFRWNNVTYNAKASLKELVDMIHESITAVDVKLKNKLSEYQQVKNGLAQIERKTTGNLMVRSLDNIVTKSDIVESESLTTLLVVVPKHSLKEWNSSYESLSKFVVPGSSRVVKEDNDFCLCSVVLFKKYEEEFKTKAREARFNVREYAFDEERINKGKADKSKLEEDKVSMEASLVRYLKVAFSQAYVDYFHLKAIRVFVESVLRYGLPVAYQYAVIQSKDKSDKKIRASLAQSFASLGKKFADGKAGDMPAEAAAFSAGHEFHPYVSSTLVLF